MTSFYVTHRAVEFTGKSGIYGLRYLSDGGFVKIKHYHDFIKFEMLRKEYLNQTFNFMPELKVPFSVSEYDILVSLIELLLSQQNWVLGLTEDLNSLAHFCQFRCST